jgi:hypothetical protein
MIKLKSLHYIVGMHWRKPGRPVLVQVDVVPVEVEELTSSNGNSGNSGSGTRNGISVTTMQLRLQFNDTIIAVHQPQKQVQPAASRFGTHLAVRPFDYTEAHYPAANLAFATAAVEVYFLYSTNQPSEVQQLVFHSGGFDAFATRQY